MEFGIVQDTKVEGWREARKTTALDSLNRVYARLKEQGVEPPSGAILEIGSGIGGVTAALQQLFPGSSIVAMDMDTDLKVQEAAEKAGVEFIQQDASKLTDQQIEELIRSRNIAQIIGFRIPGDAAKRIVEASGNAGFNGLIVFSLIEHEEEKEIVGFFEPLRWNKEATRVFIQNDRVLTEIAYAIPGAPTNPPLGKI